MGGRQSLCTVAGVMVLLLGAAAAIGILLIALHELTDYNHARIGRELERAQPVCALTKRTGAVKHNP